MINSARQQSPEPSAQRARPGRVERSEQCAVQAAVRGDPMLGTAFPASMLLLVEQPGPWGRAGLADSRFDRATARALIGRLDPHGIRVVTIRRPGRPLGVGRRRWAISDCRPGRERLVWGQFDDDAELLGLEIPAILADRTRLTGVSEQPPVTDDLPLFAVCAHGTHDVCCAIRGRPVAAALDRLRPGSVWECGHVGGDRFAANVLVLPSGVLYGRVDQSSAQALITAVDRGKVLHHHLRGRVGFPPAVQAAMALAHRERPELLIGDVRAVRTSRVGPDVTRVRLQLGDDLVDVLVGSEQSTAEWMTCQATAPSWAISYVPLSLRTVPPVNGLTTEDG